MLVASRSKSICHYASSEQRREVTCFGFPLRELFNFPTRQYTKSVCKCKDSFDSLGNDKGLLKHIDMRVNPLSPATTASGSSPVILFNARQLADPSILSIDGSCERQEPPFISGTLIATLRAVASSRSLP